MANEKEIAAAAAKAAADAALNASQTDAPATSVAEGEQVPFVLVPKAYASRLRAFGNPVAFDNAKGFEKFGVTHYQTFTCPLPDGSTLRFTSTDEKFIAAVKNDAIAKFYYKPGPAGTGGTLATDYVTRQQAKNLLEEEQADRQDAFMKSVFSVDALEASPAMRERILAGSIDRILNATT